MTNRRLSKAIRRLKSLPKGSSFFKYGYNKAKHYTYKFFKSTKVAYPNSIMLEVTNHCNLRCITCPREYLYGHQMNKGFMPIEQLKKVVDEAYPYVDSIGLTGLGETLLYKPLEEAVDYIRSKDEGIIIFISINAHLPNSVEIANRLADKIDTIQISMDGVEDIYETVRLKSDYSFFIKNVEAIAKNAQGKRADIMFNFVAIKENYHQMANVVDVASRTGVKYVNITPFNVASVTAHNISYYKLFMSDDFKGELKKANQKAIELGNIDFTVWDFKSKEGFQKCNFPWSHFYISWDGYMTPCCAKPFPKELNFGNVFKDGLLHCLNTKDYQYFRQQWHKNETPKFCEKCHMIDMPAIDMQLDTQSIEQPVY